MIHYKVIYQNDEYASIAEVTIGDNTIEVPFWYSIKNETQTEAEFEAILESQAFLLSGNKSGAIGKLVPFASGTITDESMTYVVDGVQKIHNYKLDRRNLPARLIDEMQGT